MESEMVMAQAVLGLAVFCGLAWAISEDRKAVRPGMVAAGIGLQLALALLLLKAPGFQELFLLLNRLVLALDQATRAGTGFVFGYLGGGPLPYAESQPGASFILAFQALPLVLVVSALSALLYHWRVLPWVVRGFAWLLHKTLGVGGAAGLGTAANIFVGMIEAPLFVRPYLLSMSRGELFVLMTSGMATIAGTVMVLYAAILGPVIPGAMGHILTASIISAPAAITIARLMVPLGHTFTGEGEPPPRLDKNSMEAITRGTVEGVTLLMNIVAMLVVLVALVALANGLLAFLPQVGAGPLTLERLMGWLMAPVVWLMGVPWSEAVTAGGLMGVKTVLNEFLAYLQLAQLPPEALSEKSRLIMVYAMCGFANPGSLGIMIGGLGAIVPERRAEVVALGFKAILAGTLATLMTGAIVALI